MGSIGFINKKDGDAVADRVDASAAFAGDALRELTQGAAAGRAGQQGERGGREGGHTPYSTEVLRVGLTGGLGSGKSSVARVWAEEEVPVLEADAMGRALMEPGQAVYERIVDAFGPGVVLPSGELDRAALARLAFAGDRVGELNRIVHPAVIGEQERQLAALAAAGCRLAVVESALIFEASGEGGTVPGWRERFDRIVLVAAPEAVRVERFVERSGGGDRERLREDARRRMAAQLPEAWKRERADFVIENSRTLVLLRREALRVLGVLRGAAGGGW